MRVSKLRTLLKGLGVSMPDIANISYVSKDTVEILVSEQKRADTICILQKYGFRLREGFMPNKAADPRAPADVKDQIRKNFITRLTRLSLCANPVVRDYFSSWLSSVQNETGTTTVQTKTSKIPATQCLTRQ
jgi:hypothetical protein